MAETIEQSEAPARPPRGAHRKPRPPTPTRLERWALFYLDRYSSSAANLRNVLMRRVEKHANELETDVEACREHVEALVARLTDQGYVNDRHFAQGVVKRMRARGASGLRIRSTLRQKGVSSDLIADVLGGHEGGESSGGDLAAAARYARRRRLGPFRLDPEVRKERHQRDLAALARAGFSYSVTSRVIDAPDCETVDDWILADPA